MVASKSKEVAFIVLLAGPGIPGNELLLLQKELIERAMRVSEAEIKEGLESNAKLFDVVIQSVDILKLKVDLTTKLNEMFANNPSTEIPNGMTKEQFIAMQVN